MNDTIDQVFYSINNSQDPFAKAHLIHSLHHNHGIQMNKIASQLGVSPSYVCNYIRLLKVPELVRDGFYSQSVSLTHLMILSRLPTPESMIKGYEEILKHNLSCPDTENYVREKLYGVESIGSYAEKELYDKIKDLFSGIDSRISVKIIQTRVRLKVVLKVDANVEETNQVLKKISDLSKSVAKNKEE